MNVRELREAAGRIFRAALGAVDPAEAVRRHVVRKGAALSVNGAEIDLATVRRVVVVGTGKAGGAMASAVEEILGDRPVEGTVTVKYGHLAPTRRVRLVEAGHPIPDEQGMAGARAILDLLAAAGEGDLVVALISGGGSALLPLPVAGISLQEKQALTSALLRCGATIQEMNAVRKHLSAIKGGQLARVARRRGARLVALILSDIVGDPLDAIASGPTAPDPTTYGEALAVLDRHGIRGEAPPAVLRHLEAGARGAVPETPKPGDPIFSGVLNVVIGSNILALRAARGEAEALGLRPLILSSSIEGETREVARVHAALGREVRQTGNPVRPPACLISGGETTVTVRGQGKGGRNQEFALAAALDVAGLQDVVVLSAGTDGTDGPTDAAGAVADGGTCARARALGLDPGRHLRENDAYPFFAALGDLVITGPTNTNVMDVRLVLVG